MVWSTTAKNIGSMIEGNTVRKNDAGERAGALFSGAGSAGTGVPRRRVGQPPFWHIGAEPGNDRALSPTPVACDLRLGGAAETDAAGSTGVIPGPRARDPSCSKL